MSKKYCGVVLAFATDIADDDADGLLRVLRHLQGVVDVRPVDADPRAEHVLKMRIRNDLFVAMRDELFGGGQ